MVARKDMANAIRALSIDAVEKAKSGHPGMPMGMADIAQVLWCDFLKHNPSDPSWCNRDRFVLSNGHGSMLLYSLLHLSGYDLSIDDIKNFRQLDSKTPGHPEYRHTPGVETTTGPLGQGIGNAVGMALAEKMLAAKFNTDIELIDHKTYCFVGDGCLMEGVSHEVASLAGTLGLGKLIVIWDRNGISIDGDISPWFAENVPDRFKAYNWQVIDNVDGHDPKQVSTALTKANSNDTQPTLICATTTIGFGSPNKAGSASSHGSPLGQDEAISTKINLGWEHKAFEIPNEMYDAWCSKESGEKQQSSWSNLWHDYQRKHPERAAEFSRRINSELPSGLDFSLADSINLANNSLDKIATRKASLLALNELSKFLPDLFGGSADLTGSNLTKHERSEVINPEEFGGDYLHYGVREFGMSTIMNGVALHGGFIPYGGTFLVFSDYARNAMRLSALMQQRVIYVLTHDSIGLGEDGPTHQPVEHIASLRIMPNLNLWRPANTVETFVSWQHAVKRINGPTCLALSRQSVAQNSLSREQIDNISKGAYILSDRGEDIRVVIIATGSEVELAMQASENLHEQGIGSRVVSMPCAEVFSNQDKAYVDSVLLPNVPRVAVEAGSTNYWYQWVGLKGKVIGLDEYGRSAPFSDAYTALNITSEKIVEAAKELSMINADLALS